MYGQERMTELQSNRIYNKYNPNDRFGKLTLIQRIPGGQKWICVCDCGEKVITQISGGSRACKSCARVIVAQNNTKHGESAGENRHESRLHRIWCGMKTRCNNPQNEGYVSYGERGIFVCDEWNIYTDFKKWALGNGYTETLSIDRIDNNGNYEPNNCKWTTSREQSRNKRNNHTICIDGSTMCVMDWCNALGIIKSNAYCSAKKKGITIDEYICAIWTCKHHPELNPYKASEEKNDLNTKERGDKL